MASGELTQEPRTGAVPQEQGTGRMPLVSNGNSVFSLLMATEMPTQQECAHVCIVKLLSCHLTPLRSAWCHCLCPLRSGVYAHRFLWQEGRTCAHTGPLVSQGSFGGGPFTGQVRGREQMWKQPVIKALRKRR